MAASTSGGFQQVEAKVAVLGKMGVGKTSIVTRFVTGRKESSPSSTIGVSYFTCQTQVPLSEGSQHTVSVKLKVWDTSGQERFKAMAPLYYRGASAAILVYDITDIGSYNDLITWLEELKQNAEENLIITVIGNKSDLEEKRVVSVEAGELYARGIGAKHFTTSAMHGNGVEDVFYFISTQLVARHPPKQRLANKTGTLEVCQPSKNGQSKTNCC